MNGTWRPTVILLSLSLLPGCLSLEPSKISKEPFTISNTYKVIPQKPPVPEATDGSIWHGQLTTIFTDQRARQVGDIVTVNITEVTTASEAAATTMTRKSQTVAGTPNFFGLESNPNGPWKNPSTMINAYSPNNDFAGAGQTTRTGSLSATITARVVTVLPSGNLAIEGKREIFVNNEKKEILLQGIVRPRDIAYDNTISSTQIADAKVIYTGIGVVAEWQRPGWAERLFNFIWPW
jgi:flagellar L-ring protein precursor FlgH